MLHNFRVFDERIRIPSPQADGYTQPIRATLAQIHQAMQKWLDENNGKYRINKMVVDPNAIRPFAASLQLLEAISRGQRQLMRRANPPDHPQFPPRGLLNVGRKLAADLAVEDTLRFRVGEAADHNPARRTALRT